MKQQRINKILQQTRDVYNKIALDFSDTRGHWWKGMGSFNKYVRPGDRVLDLGCGNGRMAEIFEGSQIEYLGIDNSEELIKIARGRFKNKSWVRFRVGDVLQLSSRGADGDVGVSSNIEGGGIATSLAEPRRTVASLPRNDSLFDLVLLIAVLHHLPTKELRLKVLENIFQSLRPGGRLVMLNWNLWQVFGSFDYKFRYWKYLFNWSEKIKRGVWGFSDAFVPWKMRAGQKLAEQDWQLRYVHSFTIRETKKLLRQAGFVVEGITYEKRDKRVGVLSGDHSLAVAIKK
ncbi:MAG: class I SAM-dependent methyltransferase [Patescibacteria group bacterium]